MDSKEIQEWWENGKRHRSNGPAMINREMEAWYQNGIPHRPRTDGPALIAKRDIWRKVRGNVQIIVFEGESFVCVNGCLSTKSYKGWDSDAGVSASIIREKLLK